MQDSALLWFGQFDADAGRLSEAGSDCSNFADLSAEWRGFLPLRPRVFRVARKLRVRRTTRGYGQANRDGNAMNNMADSTTVGHCIDLRAIFWAECFQTIPTRTDKKTVLHQLVSSLATSKRIAWDGVDDIVNALLERERTGTTAMGNGLALPNLRTQTVDEFMGAVAVAPAGLDFDSLDGQPTRLIILLLSPLEEREVHCELMGRLARLIHNRTLQHSVRDTRSPESLFRILTL